MTEPARPRPRVRVPRTVSTVDTPGGPARVTIVRPPRARGTLVLGHGAGGGIEANDLRVLAEQLPLEGWCVILVEQPWRVAGRRLAGRPQTLDEAWVPILAALTGGRRRLPRPLVVGGRSAGSRVACRTASLVGADAVVALSFPLHPPARLDSSRAHELMMPIDAGLPVLVVQGDHDPFGTPGQIEATVGDRARVAACHGRHGFPQAPADVLDAVRDFLAGLG